MDELIALLTDIKDGIDYYTCTTLIADGIFDSFDIIQTINELNGEYDIAIPATEIIPENFNSAAAMWAMIQRLREDD